MHSRVRALVVLLLALPCSAAAQAGRPRGQTGHLGSVHFENSGSAAAQPAFQRAMALLHSFTYGDAAKAFQEAQRADPAFAMAYWGEAMTYEHSSWREEDPAAARSALARLAGTPAERLARAGTERERRYGAAVETLVAEGVPEEARVRGWSDTLAAIALAYPTDADAEAFAALGGFTVAYLWPARDPAQRIREHDVAEARARHVFTTHPDHPAGAHYLIHADDDPEHAGRALDAARAYARIAPAAEHAQHMPSHVFVQLGLWDDATAANERAWAASRRDVRERHETGASASYHALQWLQYSYLQQGRFRAARALIDTARATLADAPADFGGSPDARYTVQDLTFRAASDLGAGWAQVRDAVAAAGQVVTSQRASGFALASDYHGGVAAAMLGDTLGAAAVARRLRAQAAALPADAQPRRMREMYALHIDGLLAQQRGDQPARIAAFARADSLEETIPPVGPPAYLVSGELLGGALVDAGRSLEAERVYAHVLERRPNRAESLRGLARAQMTARHTVDAQRTLGRLRRMWHGADAAVLGTSRPR